MSKWVSFSAAPPRSKRPFEQYCFSTRSAKESSKSLFQTPWRLFGSLGRRPQHTVEFRRHGECPPWYRPGGACVYELRGRCFSSYDRVPARARDLCEGGNNTHSNTTWDRTRVVFSLVVVIFVVSFFKRQKTKNRKKANLSLFSLS